ncbi:hypothetical protein COM85_32290, partial [Bacillus thuringiensis]
TYIKVKRKWRYLYRAIDKEGHTLDIQFRKKRDHQAAYMFMKRLVKAFGEPTVHAIYKQKRSHMPDFSFSTYKELQQLFRTA